MRMKPETRRLVYEKIIFTFVKHSYSHVGFKMLIIYKTNFFLEFRVFYLMYIDGSQVFFLGNESRNYRNQIKFSLTVKKMRIFQRTISSANESPQTAT